jgi:hypothetical protein
MLLLPMVVCLAQAPTVKVYRGDDGQVVTMIWLANKTAVVQVKAARSEIDGLVVPVNAEGRSWAARLQGNESWGLVVEYREAKRVSNRIYQYEVYAPGAKAFDVAFDADLTAQTTAESVLSLTAGQAKQLAAVARKPYPFLEKKYQKSADAKVGALTSSCGRPLTFSFEWGSFSDVFMAETDVWKACEPVVTRLMKNCAVAKTSSRLVCRGGAQLGFGVEGDDAVFTTTRLGQSQGAAFLAEVK